MIIAELEDPARFESAGELAAYVGVCPAHKHSGKHKPKSSSLSPIGNRRLRRALWTPTLSAATQSNPWLMAFYRRLIERGKPHKGRSVRDDAQIASGHLLRRQTYENA